MKMRRFAVIAGALGLAAALVSAAPAADMPVKAPPVYTMPYGSGFYVGTGLTGNGANGSIIAGGLSQGVFAGGAIVDVHGGYQVWNGSYLFAVEVGVGNQFSNGPISFPGTQSFIAYEGIKLGGALSGIFAPGGTTSTVPGQAAGAAPVFASLANRLISPYVWLGAIQRGGYNQGTVGAGVEYVLAQNWNLDARYTYAPAIDKLGEMQMLTVGLNWHF